MSRDLIFAPLCGDPGDRAIAVAARSLATRLDASVEAVFVGPSEAMVALAAGDSYVSATIMEALEEERVRAEAAARVVAQELGFALGVLSGLRHKAVAYARLAAFTVIDAESARGKGPLIDLFEALLFEERAPVLVPRGASTYDTIAIAWDGSREAAKALQAAEPLIARAKTLRILQATGKVDAKNEAAADPERVRCWLAGRNADAHIDVVSFKFDPAASLVAAALGGGDVDLIIAGAYGHARLRETIFGGATRSLLAADAPSLLLAH